MTLRFANDEARVEFDESVLALFEQHRQRHFWSTEAGGQLFCRFHHGTAYIAAATVPSEWDHRSRYSFWPSRPNEQRDIEANFAAGFHYIGDWHTHPEDCPTPSREDSRKLKDIFWHSQHELKYMLLVVVGRNPFPDGLWVGLVSRGRGVRLPVVRSLHPQET